MAARPPDRHVDVTRSSGAARPDTEIIERYEYKYLVPEALVPAIRAVAQTTSRIDRHAGDDGTYRIRSLYFDTFGLDLFRANEREAARRFKVRARIYPGRSSPVFLEVKRRIGDVIVKTRAPVGTADWAAATAGDRDVLAALPAVARDGATTFAATVLRHHLAPTMLVEYEREAYVSEVDAYARLTFDRKIAVQRRTELDLEADDARFMAVDHVARTKTLEPVCVLELKFERRPPAWMRALVRRLELTRASFSKYCYGVREDLALPSPRAIAGAFDRAPRAFDDLPRRALAAGPARERTGAELVESETGAE